MDRKEREKEQFKAKVIRLAYGLVKKDGLEGLSLRKLAQALEYSTQKLYSEFGSKSALLVLLGEDICQRQAARLNMLKKLTDPEANLLQVTHEATCFYVEEPWTAQILAALRFGNLGVELPPAFKNAADIFRSHVLALNLPSEHLEEYLNVIRALMLGALSTLHTESTKNDKTLTIKIVNDGMRLILAGWKSQKGYI